MANIAVSVYDYVKKGTDVDSVQSFVWAVELRVIHGLNGFVHLFNADAFTANIGLPVLSGFSFFGAQKFPVGCAHADINYGVRGWLLRRWILRSAVTHSKGCWVL